MTVMNLIQQLRRYLDDIRWERLKVSSDAK